MKLLTTFLCLGAVSFGMELTGWISDASCGAGNGNGSAGSRACAKSCIKDGSAPVLVTDGDGKVYHFTNGDLAKTHFDAKVKITGDIKDGKLIIAKIVDVK